MALWWNVKRAEIARFQIFYKKILRKDRTFWYMGHVSRLTPIVNCEFWERWLCLFLWRSTPNSRIYVSCRNDSWWWWPFAVQVLVGYHRSFCNQCVGAGGCFDTKTRFWQRITVYSATLRFFKTLVWRKAKFLCIQESPSIGRFMSMIPEIQKVVLLILVPDTRWRRYRVAAVQAVSNSLV